MAVTRLGAGGYPVAGIAAGINNPLTISLSSGQSVTIAFLPSRLRTITNSQGSSLSIARAAGLAATIAAASVTTLRKATIHAAAILASEQLTLAALQSRLLMLNIAISQTASLARLSNKAVTSLHGQGLFVARTVGHAASLATASATAVLKKAAHAILIPSAQAVTSADLRSLLLALVVAVPQMIAVGKLVMRTLSFIGVQSLLLKRSIGKNFRSTGGETVTLASGSSKTSAASVTTVQAFTLLKALAKPLSVSWTQGVKLLRPVIRNIALSETTLARLSRTAGKQIATGSSLNVTEQGVVAKLKLIATFGAQGVVLATLLTVHTFLITLSVASGATIALGLLIGKTIQALLPQTVQLVRTTTARFKPREIIRLMGKIASIKLFSDLDK